MDFQLNEDSLIPLYQQLMEDIKAALTEGKYAPDEKIPSESELSELYHVSRITVRRAVEELCSEGYLVKKQGKGTYVSQPKVIRKITQDKDVMGFSEACRACGMEPGAQVVNILRCPARSDEVRFLGLPPQSDVIFLQRVRTADGEPIMLTKKEFDLLNYLWQHEGTAVTRDELLSNVWGYEFSGDTNIVYVYIRYLRQKIDDKFGVKTIHTIRAVGYMFRYE